MKTIVHISADFPDPLVPAKTKAVANLLAETSGFRHVVYSLNRVSWKRGVRTLAFGDDRVAVAYGAPPYGLGLERFLRPVVDAIIDDLGRAGIRPDLLHAHKFSVDGLVTAGVAAGLKAPFIASVWGDTDIKIVDVKRGLRSRFLEIAASARLLLPAAPWTARYVQSTLAVPAERVEVLPVMTAADDVLPPKTVGNGKLISVFSLDSWKRKGLDVLVEAMDRVARTHADAVLDVFGTGRPQSLFAVAKLLQEGSPRGRVRLRGALSHGTVQPVMNGYVAFVMAPRRETYGMVHAEAALAGLPLLWARDRGIDGLIDPGIGVRCDPASPAEVADGIAYLITHEQMLKQRLAAQQAAGALRHLQRASIARAYADTLRRAMGCPPA